MMCSAVGSAALSIERVASAARTVRTAMVLAPVWEAPKEPSNQRRVNGKNQ